MPKQPSPPPPPKIEDQPDILNSTRTSPRILKKRPAMNPPSSVPAKQTLSNIDIHLTYTQAIRNQDQNHNQEPYDNEIISSLQFNDDGTLLALGDRGGRIKVFKRVSKLRNPVGIPKYEPRVTFQSHLPEFDYLKSLEIEEKIILLKWLKGKNRTDCILSSNDRTIKLWKIGDVIKPEYISSRPRSPSNIQRLLIPRRFRNAPTPAATLRKSFNNGHTFHINSVSVNSDYETFISSDDLRINLWSVDHTDQSFVIVDLKPESMENLSEVITTSVFHPKSCNIFCYSTSRGITNMCDMRVNANCDKPLRYFKYDDPSYRGFFSEVVASISDTQFSNCGNCIAIRDYIGVKLWDVRMDSKCLLHYPVQDFLKPHLCSMFENDLIFDKFLISWSHNDRRIVTGSYSDLFSISEPNVQESVTKSTLFQISDEYKDIRHHVLKAKRVLPEGVKVERPLEDIRFDDLDIQKRVMLSQWHPTENILAVASSSNVCLLNEKKLFM